MIITTVILGTVMPLFVKWNMKQIQNNKQRYTEDHPSVYDPLLETMSQKGNELEEEPAQPRTRYRMSEIDEQVKNELQQKYGGKKRGWWHNFDERYMKPFFIRDFKARRQDIKQQNKIMKQNYSRYAGTSKVG